MVKITDRPTEIEKAISETPSNSNSNMGWWVGVAFVVVVVFMAIAFCFGYKMLNYAFTEKLITATNYPKTPFVFIAVVFAIGLMFIDSILKTLKYNNRQSDNLIMSLIQSIGIGAALAWGLLK